MNHLIKLPQKWLTKITYNLNIGQKISYGYAFSLSIAVVGTVTGFIIGDYYQKSAKQQKDHAHYELRLLHRLQTAVLQARASQQMFIPLITHKPELLKKEYSEFSTYAAEVKQLWSEVQSYINSENYKHEKHAEGLPIFLQSFSNVPETYIQQVEKIMERIPADKHLQSEEIEAVQGIMVKFSSDSLALKYDTMDDELNAVIDASYKDDKEAEATLIHAEAIRFQIVVASIFFSVVLATLFSTYTTRMLTDPIKALTKVARQTTEELKFDMLAPVMTGDEVGVLANSLNSLIQRLANYTHELEQARETLEIRVEERTQELSQVIRSLQQTQSQLIQAEKMSALGQLVAGVAHEINNPVNFIYGNLTYVNNYTNDLLSLIDLYQQTYCTTQPEISNLIKEIDLDFLCEDLPKILDSMKLGADRIREIVLSLRNFSRLDEAEMKTVNIHEGIDSSLLILQHRLKGKSKHSTIEIIKEYGNLPQVECSAGQLNQVFMNILVNSIDALKQQYQECSFEDGKSHPNTIIIRTELFQNSVVRISFKDNGSGMTENVKARIFDPFFTTKPIGEGTGLGLSISYQIVVDKHKGKITCLSEPGHGCEFQIDIPIRQNCSL